MSDGDETVNKIVSTVGLWWPDAEEGDVRTAADAWETFAKAIEHAHDEGRAGASQARAHWTGAASEAFGTHWQGFDQAMPTTAEGARSLASALREFADEVEHAKHQVYELAIEIGASIAIGTALAFFTFGTSEAAAAGTIATLRAAAMRIAAQLTARVGSIAARSIIGATFGAVSGLGGNAVSQVARVEGFGDGGYSGTEALQATAFGGLTGGVLGGAGGAWAKFRPGARVPTGGGEVPDGPAPVPDNPSAYSTAYEMQLKPGDLGKSRSVHFNRANASLDEAIQSDPAFKDMMEQLSPGVSDRVASTGGRQNPLDYTWHHTLSEQAGGRDGVMRLVPTAQHEPGSVFQPVIHPGNRGGYSEWGVPNGAPPNR